jgi:hypothetical protein
MTHFNKSQRSEIREAMAREARPVLLVDNLLTDFWLQRKGLTDKIVRNSFPDYYPFLRFGSATLYRPPQPQNQPAPLNYLCFGPKDVSPQSPLVFPEVFLTVENPTALTFWMKAKEPGLILSDRQENNDRGFSLNPDGQMVFQLGGARQLATNPASIKFGVWHHVCLALGPEKQHIFIGGVPVATSEIKVHKHFIIPRFSGLGAFRGRIFDVIHRVDRVKPQRARKFLSASRRP